MCGIYNRSYVAYLTCPSQDNFCQSGIVRGFDPTFYGYVLWDLDITNSA